MKKGFTLIELLAVIVILAIIALIATPLVINIIEASNKNGSVMSMKIIEKSVKLYFVDHNIESWDENVVFNCNDGVCKSGDDVLNINGKFPEKGKIFLDKKGNITYDGLVINGYNCYKEHNKYVCDKEKTRKIFYENSIVLNNSKASSLLDYNIYGNKESVGDKTDNLMKKIESITGSGAEYELIYNGFKATTQTLNGGYGNWIKIPLIYLNDIKWGTTYTLTCNIEQSIQGMNSLMRIGYPRNTTNAWNDFKNLGITESGVYSLTFTLPDEPPEDFGQTNYGSNDIQLFFNIQRAVLEEYGTITVTDIMLTEGATAKEYEPYGYKIPINVSGKNLFNINNITPDVENVTISENVIQTHTYGVGIKDTLKEICPELKPGDTVVLSGETNASTNGSLINGIYLTKSKIRWSFGEALTITQDHLDSHLVFYCVRQDGVNTEGYYKNVQIEIGTTSSQYEPYYIETTNIYISEPLRCIDEICDYIDFKNQKIVRYIEESDNGTLKLLKTSKQDNIELPSILLSEGINNVSVDTKISPSKIELEYYK